MRALEVAGQRIDSGPTVMTMRWAFDQLFTAADRSIDDYVQLEGLEILARHGWADGSRLDLFAEVERNVQAITTFASKQDAEGYRRFCDHVERIYEIVEAPFLRSERPALGSIVSAKGLRGTLEFATIDWHRSMWKALEQFFPDPRLRQLFGRYATYFGSSPFRCPATLNLIAHVERVGVWRVAGGMIKLAEGLTTLATELGVEIRTGAEVDKIVVRDGRAIGVRLASGERIDADAIITNAAPQALSAGKFGDEVRDSVRLDRSEPRSLSAVTWSAVARTRGFPLGHHSVFFSTDYPREFRSLERGDLIEEPTVYICAQDRETAPDLDANPEWGEPERLLILVNAPARGDEDPWTEAELAALRERSFALMTRAGLEFDIVDERQTTPTDFERMFPATGGGLYGSATHSMMAPFKRPPARARVRGLYLAGGGAHPGAGIPMVCLSGQIAGRSAAADMRR